MTGRPARVRVCSVDDVPMHEGRSVRVGGRHLAVFRSQSGFHILDNACPHLGGPLADGLVSEATIACPLHERRFDLETGRAVGHECGDVTAYRVEASGGDVFIFVQGAVPCALTG